MNEAADQIEAADGHPPTWVVAQPGAAAQTNQLFEDEGIGGSIKIIMVVHASSREDVDVRSQDQLYIGAYWADRAETSLSAAERLGALIERLAANGDGFADWFVGEDTPLPGSADLESWLAAKFDPAVSGRKAHLGAAFELLSDKGESPRRLSLLITCGIHDTLPVLTNALVLSPRDEDALEVIPGRAENLLDATVTSWEPDWAVASSARLRSAAFDTLGRQRGPFPGLLTWVSACCVPGSAVHGLVVEPEQVNNGHLLDYRDLISLDDAAGMSATAQTWSDLGVFTAFPQR